MPEVDIDVKMSHRPTGSVRAGLGVAAFNEQFEEQFNVSVKRINIGLRQVFQELDSKADTNSGSSTMLREEEPLLQRPENWGLRIRFVTQLWNYVADDITAYAASHWWDENNRHVCVSLACRWHHAAAEPVQRTEAKGALRQMDTTMHLVVERYVKPWTKNTRSGLAVLLNSGYSSAHRKGTTLETLSKAEVFISHSWGDSFEDFTKALPLSLYMDTVVWVCSFALWQHADISGLLHNLAECPFSKALRSCPRVLVVSSSSISVFDRCWVVLEAALAMEWNKEYHICFPDSSTAMGEDTLARVDKLDMTNCSASIESDKEKIVAYANSHLGGLNHLNARVQQTVRHAIEEAEVMLAAMRGDVHTLENVAGSLRTWRSMRGRGVVHVAAEHSHARSLVEILNTIGHDQIDLEDNNGSTPLSVAARKGALASVACLLSFSANVNAGAAKEGGLTPLHFSVMQGHRKVSHLLIASKADLQIEACYLDTDGRRPLDIAIREGLEDLVKDFVAARADVNASSKGNGTFPLFVAASNGHPSIVTLLYNAAADVDARTQDEYGRTALTRAVMSGKQATAHLLLAQKADPHLEDNKGNSATKVLKGIIEGTSAPSRGSMKMPSHTVKALYTNGSQSLPVAVSAYESDESAIAFALTTMAIITEDSKNSRYQMRTRKQHFLESRPEPSCCKTSCSCLSRLCRWHKPAAARLTNITFASDHADERDAETDEDTESDQKYSLRPSRQTALDSRYIVESHADTRASMGVGRTCLVGRLAPPQKEIMWM